jgi:HEAT repeat protein
VPRVEGDAFFQEVWADLHSREQHRRKAALERLANLKPNASRAVVAQELIELTKVEDVWIRQGAVKALGAWGSKDEVPALQRAMAHNDVFTRKEALKVVGRFRDERTLEGVIVGFRDPMTRAEAGQALRDMGPMAETSVLALIKSLPRDEWMLKKPAIEVLADIGTEKSVPVLTDVATNGHRFAAEPAQKALAAIAKREKQ